jgi:diguanylate cyclase (GGDEF)-like protein
MFRLWLRLSFITVAVAVFALGAYVWLELQDNVSAAEVRAQSRAQAVLAATQRLGANNTPPTQAEVDVATSLNIAAIDVLNADGHVELSIGTLVGDPATRALEPAVLAARTANGPSSTEIEFDNVGGYTPLQLQPFDLLGSGHYGAEYLYPLSQISPGRTGAVRIVATYPGIVQEAHTLALRSLGLAAVIAGSMIFAMWILLNALVARPLRSYSETAMRIAGGEMVRMPVMALDEMGQLGQAINGMADALGYQATVDPLTGLYNLRHLTSRLENLMDEAKLSREPLALIVCDLDNLKPVNDTYGHHAGDLVLQAIAREMQAWASAGYICWRTGGDEFAAALPGADAEAAINEALRLERAINSLTIPLSGNNAVRTSVSLGLALYPGDGDSVGSLLGTADRRMYEAKSDKTGERRLERSLVA